MRAVAINNILNIFIKIRWHKSDIYSKSKEKEYFFLVFLNLTQIIHVMRFISSSTFPLKAMVALLLLHFPSAHAQDVEGKSLKQHLKDLASDDYVLRQAAENYLWKNGEGLTEILKEHSQSDDPEVSFRAQAIYQKVLAGVFPDTPKAIMEQVEIIRKQKNYGVAIRAIDRLVELRGYKQIIYLYALHKEPAIKKRLHDKALVVLPFLLNDYLQKGKLADAESILKKLPIQGSVANMLACLYSHQGKVEEKIKSLGADSKSELLYALYREKRDYQSMLKWAKANGEEEKAAHVEVLLGNPLPLVNLIKNADYPGRKHVQNEQQKIAYEAIEALYLGNLEEADEKIKALTDDLSDQIITAQITNRLQTAVICGNTIPIEKHFEKVYSYLDKRRYNFYSNYLLGAERQHIILRQIGVPEDRKKLSTWVKEQIEEVKRLSPRRPFFGKSGKVFNDLIHAAHVYNEKGDEKSVRDILEPLFWETHRSSTKAHKEYIKQLKEQDLTWFLYEEAQKYNAKDKENFINTVLAGMTNFANKEVILDEFKDENGILTYDKLIDFLSIQGLVRRELASDVDKLQSELLKKAEGNKALYYAVLLLAESRGDVLTAKKLRANLRNLNSHHGDEIKYLDILLQLGEWEEVCKTYEAYEKKGPLNSLQYCYWAIALKKLGREKEFKDKYALYKVYSWNNNDYLERAASYFTSHGLYDLALQQYEYILSSELYPNKRYSQYTISLYSIVSSQLTSYEPLYIKKRQWKKAASVAMIARAMNIYESNATLNLNRRISFLVTLSNHADFSRGMQLLDTNPEVAKKLIARCVDSASGGGSLADYYFPALKQAGLKGLHKDAYNKLLVNLRESMKYFPNSADTLNTFAWLAARCGYDLKEAEKCSLKSLKLAPYSGAYQDTLAEVYFAQGKRAKALEASQLSLDYALMGKSRQNYSSTAAMSWYQTLYKQFEHFKNDPLPNNE